MSTFPCNVPNRIASRRYKNFQASRDSCSWFDNIETSRTAEHFCAYLKMKILSGPEGDGLLTNVEVHEWLKEKKFETERKDVPEGEIKIPHATASIARQVRKYIETSPAGNVTVASLRSLYAKLEKFKLTSVEKLMIANIRPEAYAHLTPLIVDAYSRYDEDQLYEILGIINETLEKRTKPSEWNTEETAEQGEAVATEEENEINGKMESIVDEAVNGSNSLLEQHEHAVQTMVKEEICEKTEDIVDNAVDAVNGVRLSTIGPS